jgi:hypothetical protein
LIGGDHDGEIALIPRITLTPSAKSTNHAFVLRRRQFPVKLAFAMSINKAQGQSLKFVGLDLRVPVFSHGQLYVALSRATSSKNIKILLPQNDLQACTTTNVVYPEILLRPSQVSIVDGHPSLMRTDELTALTLLLRISQMLYSMLSQYRTRDM